MKLWTWTALLVLAVPQLGWGQADRTSNLAAAPETAATPSRSDYSVIGATPKQEALLLSQLQIMHPEILPSRIVLVPHWKYVDTARTFQLHVPTGYTSAMFTHLPSRTVFIDSDRYVSDDSLGFWLAHELGHLAANSVSESGADKAAREYRRRRKDARQPDVHRSGTDRVTRAVQNLSGHITAIMN